MPRDDQSLLLDMLIAAREARGITIDVTWEEFSTNRVLQLATERLLQNIGEAGARLSPETRQRLPHVPWHDVVGMRHRLVHEYHRVDAGRVWQVVSSDLAPLIDAIVALLPDPDGTQ